jgi:uncharacterized membrane protein YoaK (UPF0700 family)
VTAPVAPPPPESETLAVAFALTLAGGFLDAFTWVAHDGVLANAQTGNVVLAGVNAAAGQWSEALRRLPPILAFVVGVLASHALRERRWLDLRRISLVVEIAILSLVMMLHVRLPDVAGTLGISFAAALQTTSFSKVEGMAFSSVMTTGNLGRFADALFHRLRGTSDAKHRRHAWIFASIVCMFAAGAAIGAWTTLIFGSYALAAPIMLFAWVLFAAGRAAHAK